MPAVTPTEVLLERILDRLDRVVELLEERPAGTASRPPVETPPAGGAPTPADPDEQQPDEQPVVRRRTRTRKTSSTSREAVNP